MSIPLYTTEEKQQVFYERYKRIESIEDFDNWVAEHNIMLNNTHESYVAYLESFKKKWGVDTSNIGEPFIVYRGLNDGSYKNFTSAQRRLFLNDYSEDDFIRLINEEIKSLKEDTQYSRYLAEHQLGFDEWHALSYLQHYEGDTPCLDFTKDFHMALFFATDKVSSGNSNPLSKYISFYYMTYPWEYDIYRMYGHGAQTADKGIADYEGPYSIDYSEARDLLRTMPFNDLFATLKDEKYPYMAIDNEAWVMVAPHIDINEKHAIMNNNVVNQNGCFAVNFSTRKPYEHGKLWCVDINKDVIPHIEEILKSKGIDKTTVYSADGNLEIVRAIRDNTNDLIKSDVAKNGLRAI